MRWVFEHRDDARALGLLGRAHAEDVLSPQAASQRMKARLEEIYQEIRQVDKTPAYESAA
jgi:hypothetical protein